MRILVAPLLVALAGCTSIPSCGGGLRAAQRIELYFGSDVPSGTRVTAPEWQRFSETVLTPAFPDGFTVAEASGQWRNPRGTIDRESVKVVTVIGTDLATAQKIAATYRAQFHQDAVGITQARVCAAF